MIEVLQKIVVALNLLSLALASGTSTIPAQPLNRLTSVEILQKNPILRDIAACESTGSVENEPRQFNADGSVLWGRDHGVIVKRDVGMFQINLKAHGEELKALDLDVINSADDNANYALLLFERNGTRDWLASKSCWKQ